MLDIPFLLDKCEECGSKWRPSDRDASKRCLVCGSSNVTEARPGVVIGAGAMVLGLAALVFAATRTHERAQDASGGSAKLASGSTYVAPISTAAPGSEPAASASAPSVTANAAKANGDAATSPAKSAGELPVISSADAANPDQFPSADCSVSRSETGHKVCASPTLTRMDQELSLVYGLAGQNADNKSTLAEEQIRWQRTVLDACKDEACMANAYKQRTEKLTGELAGQDQ